MIPGHKRVRCEASRWARHHSQILPLFRSHLTRDTAAMFPLPQNTVTSTEHECRDPHLPTVSHTENAEEEGRCVVLGLPKIIQRVQHPPRRLLRCHRISTTGSRRRDGAACWSDPGRMARERKYVPAVWSHHQRQGRNHGNQQVHTAEIGVQRGDGGTHRAGPGARRRGRRSQEVVGRGPFGGTSSPEQSDRSSIPSGTGYGENVPDHETVGGELGASRSMKTGQKKRLLRGIKKTKTMWERWYEAIKEEEKQQSNKDVKVQCIDFCEATTSDVHAVLGTLLPTCEEVPPATSTCSGGNCGISGKPTPLPTDPPCSQVPDHDVTLTEKDEIRQNMTFGNTTISPNCVLNNGATHNTQIFEDLCQKKKIRSAPSWAMRNSTWRCIGLARSLSSFHHTFQPDHHMDSHAAPKTMSHSCECQISCERFAGLSGENLSGVSTDYTDCWGWHCLVAAGPRFTLTYRWITRHVPSCRSTRNVFVFAHLCMVWPVQLTNGRAKSTGFLFWMMGVASPGFTRRAGPPPKMTPRNTKINTESRAQKYKYKNKCRCARPRKYKYKNKYKDTRARKNKNKHRKAHNNTNTKTNTGARGRKHQHNKQHKHGTTNIQQSHN